VFVGICFGGPFALMTAADGVVAGAVTWHGTRMDAYLERATDMRCPMRHHFGSVDPFVNAEAIDAIRKAFAGRSDVHFFVHEGATHGFSHRMSARSYQERAERAGMASVLELVELV
jgi:carboxymethylenebutenolidase